jgi:hypothetical protein
LPLSSGFAPAPVGTLCNAGGNRDQQQEDLEKAISAVRRYPKYSFNEVHDSLRQTGNRSIGSLIDTSHSDSPRNGCQVCRLRGIAQRGAPAHPAGPEGPRVPVGRIWRPPGRLLLQRPTHVKPRRSVIGVPHRRWWQDRCVGTRCRGRSAKSRCERRLSGQFRAASRPWHAPIDAFQQHRQLRRAQQDCSTVQRRRGSPRVIYLQPWTASAPISALCLRTRLNRDPVPFHDNGESMLSMPSAM